MAISSTYLSRHASSHRAPTAGGKQAYWLFLLFAFYGPSVSVIGNFRYVEILVLTLLFLNLKNAFGSAGKWERTFAGLFVLTAFMQVVSDLVNGASVEGTLKRSFTYLILALLVIGVRLLWRGDPKRLRWILAGYCLSYVTVLYLGQSASAKYEFMAWRLGLGTAATLAICLIPLWLPRLYWFVGPALLAMSAVHLASGARSLAVLVLGSGLLAIWGSLRQPALPPPFRSDKLMAFIVLGVVALASTYYGAKWATEARMFPAEVQTKMDYQFSNPYGILAAGRPDTVAAIYGIIKKPLLGFGSTNVDPDVYATYIDLSTSSYIWNQNYSAIVRNRWNNEWSLGNPSHSHLFGAWIDAGVIAAVAWFAVIAVAVYVLQRTMSWHHPASPLFILTSLLVLWDTLFSPGPIRMDVAIRLAILIYALSVLQNFDGVGRTKRIKL